MIISFWGKGGVGKTTCAASAATYLASKNFKTLLISSDLTPSLSDILGLNVHSKITKVSDFQNLFAIELDEEVIVDMWIKKFGEEVYEVISSFLPVDKSIIEYVAKAPGISDEFMLSYLIDLLEKDEYDYIIWDTAPAGGTLRLLKIEEQFYQHLGEAAKLYFSIKSVLEKIKRRREKSPLEIIMDWRKLAEKVLKTISSKDFKAYIVTIPEWLGYVQTKRIIQELREFNVNIGGIIINQVADKNLCEGDFWRKRVAQHEKYLRMMEEEWRNRFKMKVISLQPYEIKGVSFLNRFSENLKDLIEDNL